MRWYNKTLLTYFVCLILSMIGAYLDRNDVPSYPMTTGDHVFEVFIFALLLFVIALFFYGIAKLISWLFVRRTN